MTQAKFVIASDNHGDEQNDELVEKFFAWLADFKPDIVVHGGDNFNFAALRKKASAEEKMIAIAPDIEAGFDFASRFFSYGKRRFWTRGNHDERPYTFARDCKDAATQHAAATVCNDIDRLMEKRKVKVLPYDSRVGVLDVEGVRSIHGYAAGITAARKFALVYGSCAFSHTHSMDVSPVEKFPEPAIAYGVGCLLKIDQSYNASQIAKLRHENGFCYGFTNGTRATYLQARYQDETFYAAENLKAY